MDGSLEPWPAVAADFPEPALLLGNGLSINVWPQFGYGRLLDHAVHGGLTAADLALFGDTPNFEAVLADLGTTLRVNGVLDLPTAPVLERYRGIQRGLGHAVRAVHLRRSAVPDATLEAIRDELLRYAWIFTTSYDLILYWAIGCGGSFAPFKDHFRWGDRLEFDPNRSRVASDEIPIYFLHGALHLVVGGSGATWKLRQQALATILEQFGEPIAGDPHARPLLVTEGSAREKLRAIEGNRYLSHALDRLRERDNPLVIFGSSLSAQDQHLVDVLNEHGGRPVAYAMLPAGKRELATRQADIYGRVDGTPLRFFDATSHPLGASALRVTGA